MPRKKATTHANSPQRDSGLHRKSYLPLRRFMQALRAHANLSQRDLADMLDRTQKWIWDCEAGNRRIDVAEFMTWCEACGVDPADAMRAYRDSIKAKIPYKTPDTNKLWLEVAEDIKKS